MGVFNQRLEVLFPRAGALGCTVCLAPPPFLLVYLCANVGPHGPPAATLWGLLAVGWPAPFHNPPPRWVLQTLPCRASSSSGCLSPPLLQVWMNVSSLSPWVSDFHTVRFSVSSGCFLFLNCYCPSFGCARRHSVSTYASILAWRAGQFLCLPNWELAENIDEGNGYRQRCMGLSGNRTQFWFLAQWHKGQHIAMDAPQPPVTGTAVAPGAILLQEQHKAASVA